MRPHQPYKRFGLIANYIEKKRKAECQKCKTPVPKQGVEKTINFWSRHYRNIAVRLGGTVPKEGTPATPKVDPRRPYKRDLSDIMILRQDDGTSLDS